MTRRGMLRVLALAPLAVRLPPARLSPRKKRGTYQAAYPSTY